MIVNPLVIQLGTVLFQTKKWAPSNYMMRFHVFSQRAKCKDKAGWKCPMESTEFQPCHQTFVGNPMTLSHAISKKYNPLTATLLLQQAQRNDHMVWDQETVYCCPSPGHVWHPASWLQSPQRPQRHICGLQNFLLPTTSRLLQNGVPQPLWLAQPGPTLPPHLQEAHHS